MKYVIVRSLGLEVARLGSEVEGHSDLLKEGERIISAGFCSLNPASSFSGEGFVAAYVWGESFALKVKNRGQTDEKIIEKTISFRG